MVRWCERDRAAAQSPETPDVEAIEKRIQLLLDATRRERDRSSARTDGVQTRATVLISAAGILGGVQGAGAGFSSPWGVVSIVTYVLAAIAGLVLLWPLKVLVVSNQTYFFEMMDYHPVDLQEALLRNELNAVSHAQKRLTFRSWTLIVGFTLLAAAWGASVAAMMDSWSHPPGESPIKVEIVE